MTKVVHFQYQPRDEPEPCVKFTACGLVGNPSHGSSNDPDEVDCLNCLRTRHYREAIEEQDSAMTLDEFIDRYPNAQYLETDRLGMERWSNGEGEGSEHESEWFSPNTGEHLEDWTRDGPLI